MNKLGERCSDVLPWPPVGLTYYGVQDWYLACEIILTQLNLKTQNLVGILLT